MAKTLKDLFLALLNATLILVALCLFLLVMLMSKADSLTATFAEHLSVVQPLQDSVQSTRAEIVALRADLADMKDQSGDASSATLARVQDRLASVETKLNEMQASMATLRDAPTRLIDYTIDQAAQKTAETVTRIRGCVPAETPQPANS